MTFVLPLFVRISIPLRAKIGVHVNIISFVRRENEQFLISLVKNADELKVLSHLQGLYEAAMSNMTVPENDMAVFQMLTFTHYHFLFSTACLMRCHLSEAFASARVPIDGALVGAQIIFDRASQVAYTRREKPFDNFARHLGNVIRDNKELPHPLVPALFELHKKFSTFASHADIGSFAHRVDIVKEPEPMITVQYFQFSKNDAERNIHGLSLLHTFVMILDVFSDFLVVEQKAVPEQWRQELHGLGKAIERQQTELKKNLPEEY